VKVEMQRLLPYFQQLKLKRITHSAASSRNQNKGGLSTWDNEG
jgi:hypothetical protein